MCGFSKADDAARSHDANKRYVDFMREIAPQSLTYRSLATPSKRKEKFMFATLDDQMKHDDAAATTPKQRMVEWAVIALVAVVLFGGLLFAIQALA
jgi:hypothetical protein